ncbi:MAG: PTS glucose transporter subunit IIA [Solobacterium sp.]|jgi:glucose-specific phosphotransferase system IIA component|nr:PTS glucose transporter subunit IIA [Solobacterium sp.]MCH4265874.1 PTS glucose transporter subunit IIA [Solobacterium sp.]
MGFNLFKKKEAVKPVCEDNEIIAPISGRLEDISSVKDGVFSEKMMGDGIAITVSLDQAQILAPASGELTAFFPTCHAFGITMNNGVELLVHIGIDTVEANGKGFKALARKQGDQVKAGEPIVAVDFKTLGETYRMPVMLIVTNANDHQISFPTGTDVQQNEVIVKLN